MRNFIPSFPTLPALQKTFVDFCFSNLPGNFALKNGRGLMAGVFGELFMVSVSHETKHKNSSKNSGKIQSKNRSKIRDENSKNSGNFRSCTRVRGPPVALHVSQQISSESRGFSGVAVASRYTPP